MRALSSERSNGDLHNRWSVTTVGEVVDNYDGRRRPVKSADRAKRQGEYPYYGASGIIDSVDDYLFDGTYLLVAEDGANLLSRSTPIAFTATGRFWVNNHAHILKTKDACSLDYLQHYLNWLDVAPYVTGSAQPKLTQKALNRIPLPLPPLAEQRRIVAKIDSIIARSQKARAELMRIPVLVERYKQAVLSSAFRGDLTEDWRDKRAKSVTKVLEEVAQARSAYFEHEGRTEKPPAMPSWKPPIDLPPNWSWASVDQLATLLQYGSSAKTSDDVSGGVPVLRMGNIVDGNLDCRSLKYLPKTHGEFPELLLADGDILFNRTNSAELVGKTAVYFDTGHPTSFASYLIRVRVIGYLPELLSAYINSMFGRDWVRSVVNQQVGQANVNGTKLRELGVPLLPMDEQKELWCRIKKAFGKIDRAANEAMRAMKLLDRLDQATLAKAFRGELIAPCKQVSDNQTQSYAAAKSVTAVKRSLTVIE